MTDVGAAGANSLGSQAGPDPWERFGWFMSSVWLLFLIFPIIGVFQTGVPTWRAVLSVGLFVAFAGVYLHAYVAVSRAAPDGVTRVGWIHLGVMAATLVVIFALSGVPATGGAPYLGALAMFVLPVRAGIAVTAAAVLMTVVVGALTGSLGDIWFLGIITVLVAAITGSVQVIERRASQRDSLVAELGVAAERERVARDVHDVVGHTLTAMSLKSELAARLVHADPDRAQREIADVAALSRQALAEMRAAVGGLRTAHLTDEIASAQRVLAAAGMRAEVPTEVSVVDPRHRVLFAWVLREAITNVVRHSNANVCRVDLTSSGIVVGDDGVGMGRGPGRGSEGNGLRGIRERVAAAGGEVHVSDADPGTRLEVTMP